MTNSSIADCCVRQDWAAQREIVEYLPAAWKEWVGNRTIEIESPYYEPGSRPAPAPTASGNYASKDNGREPVELDRRPGVAAEILVPGNSRHFPAYNNPRLAVALCSAVNDWTADRWITEGESPARWGSILIPTQLPDEAAREIRRVGTHARMAQVLMSVNGLGKPFGHAAYNPIYKAATELGLPVAIHVASDSTPDTLSQSTAVGPPATFGEYQALAAQSLMTHVVTLIGQGVFERFPEMRVMLIGGGVGWIAPTLWRCDAQYRAFGRDVPWVRRRPSEYFSDHFHVTTFDMEREATVLAATFRSFPELERLLCFGSGFPGFRAWDVGDLEHAVPEEWLSKVLLENAADLYGEQLMEGASP